MKQKRSERFRTKLAFDLRGLCAGRELSVRAVADAAKNIREASDEGRLAEIIVNWQRAAD
jgi:hypothetical protein